MLRELHWLPINSRIHYKVLLLTYRCLHGLGPKYLSHWLNCYVPARRQKFGLLTSYCSVAPWYGPPWENVDSLTSAAPTL